MFLVVERAVNIGAAVLEGREQEAQLGRRYNPIGLHAVEDILRHIVAQGRLCHFHGTHAAQ